MATFELEAPFGFSLAPAADFYAGFTPMGGAANRREQVLQLVFHLDESFEAVSAVLVQRASKIDVTLEGSNDKTRAGRQLSRMLGLGVDGREWLALGERIPEVGAMQHGFFTAAFPSPYEAAIGGVLSQRSSMAQSQAIRRRMCRTFAGLELIPSPTELLAMPSFEGVPDAKWNVLHGIARAALDGTIDAERLRELPSEFALQRLESLHGVGPWTAAHMLIRGAATQDVLQTNEPRVQRAFAHVFSRPESEFVRAAEAWRPFRTWVSILLMRQLLRDGLWNVTLSRAASTGSSARR